MDHTDAFTHEEGALEYGEGNKKGAMKFTGTFALIEPSPFYFWFLATDYQTFVVVKMCVTTGSAKQEFAMVLSTVGRDGGNVPEEAWRPALLEAGVNIDELQGTPQDECQHGKPPEGPDTASLCSSVPLQSDLDLEKYAGSWHALWVPKAFHAEDCPVHASFVAGTSLAFFYKTFRSGSYYTSPAEAEVVGPSTLTVTMPSVTTGHVTYSVVATDYLSYSVVAVCGLDGTDNVAAESVRVYGRRWRLGAEAQAKVTEVLGRLNVTLEDLAEVNVTGCPLDICPNHQTLMPDFDGLQFGGEWREVGRLADSDTFPAPFADGTCVSYVHSLAINTSLFVQRQARVDANEVTDPPARRLPNRVVSFRSSGRSGGASGTVERNTFEARPADGLADDGRYVITVPAGEPRVMYSVMASDYESWAIVLVCTDSFALGSNENHAAQTLWLLLSRPGESDAASKAGLRDALARVDLDEAQFASTAESASDECYARSCPETPSVVQAQFDPSQVVGHWFVVMQTPDAADTTVCPSHTFVYRKDSLVLRMARLQLDGRLLSSSYTVQLSATSNGTFVAENVDDTEDKFEFCFLDSDAYQTYIVMYACANSNAGHGISRTWVLCRKGSFEACAPVRVLDALLHAYVDVSTLGYEDHGHRLCQPPRDTSDEHDARPAGSGGARSAGTPMRILHLASSTINCLLRVAGFYS